MRKILLLFLLISSFLSCNNAKDNQVNVSTIPVNFEFERFDKAFYTSSEKGLKKLKEKYPILFPKQVHDSVWIHKINNKDEQELFAETQKIFNDDEFLQEQLISLFKHIKYYNKSFTSPKVITMLSNIDYDNRVVYADSLLLISLDAYLGEKHLFYNDYPKYIKQNNHKGHIIVDVANSIVHQQIVPNSNRTFLEKIIFEGKKMYVLDLFLPQITDQEKIGYSLDKNTWILENEEQVWKYFIENKILFSTETKLNKRFIENGPFSKFYLSEDKNSPGKVGVWIGWQIVRSYMQNNDVSLQQLLRNKGIEIFNKSKYKPRK
ncbi:protein involved in gliding motility GldB [Lutibacter sp. Hel_I_33_5]|uniref:gliding motility lipoprotein GldB n=1 Tax=Lutibacter sp. Hel_I_33_5 TaxID=1566289 RepID=UPI0011AA33B2|nr:gliding motility lipoprotein GldB [Lutibacter sp. Hel_I_33_5]TVZ56722.1 protein involved in gliding motility GldB [Lutibacter sp. Hel_I_33_5]